MEAVGREARMRGCWGSSRVLRWGCWRPTQCVRTKDEVVMSQMEMDTRRSWVMSLIRLCESSRQAAKEEEPLVDLVRAAKVAVRWPCLFRILRMTVESTPRAD